MNLFTTSTKMRYLSRREDVLKRFFNGDRKKEKEK
jgi:hypothetical protein